MINLFQYATKELSQDAFLLWLIASACDEDKVIRQVSIDFIAFLTGKRELDIKRIDLRPQWNHIDIPVKIETGKEIFYIFIEDKTTSDEHNQLETYNTKIEGNDTISKCERYKLFYKTDVIFEDERARVDKAGWSIVELDDIRAFWEKYVHCENIIISMYARRIIEIHDAINNTSLPKVIEDREIEMLAWKGYFLNNIIPKISTMCNASVIKTSYKYIALIIKPKDNDNDGIPYLEIRDRDCVGGNYKALLLTYGMADKKKRIPEWDDIIEINNRLGNASDFVESQKNATKQLLTMDPQKCVSEEEYLEKLIKCIDVYNQIMNELS